MKPERWRQVDELFQAALERAPEDRSTFISEACGTDDSLRREVEALLAADAKAGNLIESPAYAVAAPLLVGGDAPSLVGSTIGHYQIISLLGKGGMGEVYTARDTRLERKVALKLLPAEFTTDADRTRRFKREARTASALNHPNILTIYDIGVDDGRHFIAAELVGGVTLRQKLAGQSLRLAEAVEIAMQIASALDAAHSAGIAHRDIKPENVMLRPDGLVKVLDFGLAKLTEAAPSVIDSQAGTLARNSTEAGAVLGTPRYMSPEQARGQEVDGRSDIFSFGIVLYEMIAGQPPFTGVNALDIVSTILTQEPAPLRQHFPDLPAELQGIVSKALRKDPEQRYQHSKDLLIELKDLKQELEFAAKLKGGASTIPPESALTDTPAANAVTNEAATRTTSSAQVIIGEIKHHKLGVAFALITLVAVVAGLGILLYKLMGRSQTQYSPGLVSQISPFTSFPGSESDPAFSPDGNQVAFVWDGEKGDNEDVFVKIIGAGVPLRLTANPAADTDPVWSPDNRYIAFLRHSSASSGFYLIPALGGPERKLAEAVSDRFDIFGHSLSYSPDGKFLAVADKASPQEPFGIFLLSIETGEKRRLTTPPARYPHQWTGDWNPAFSPDGNTLAFTRTSSGGVNDIYLVPVIGGEPVRLTFDNMFANYPTWTADNRELLFSSHRGGSISYLWRIAVTGGAPERVAGVGQNASSPAISRQGSRLAYTQSLEDMNIWRFEAASSTDKGKSPTRLISSTLMDDSQQYSPDGRRIVFASTRSGSLEIWVCDSDGSNPVQLTNIGGPWTGTPRWSPDGRHIAFDSRLEGKADVYVISAEGGRPRRLTTGPSENFTPSYSRDGRFVYFGSYRSGSLQVWKLPSEGGEEVQVTKGGGFEGFESPDGKFFYYAKGLSMPGIWRVPVGGGEETPVLDSDKAGYWRYWAVVSEGIYYATAVEPSRPVIKFFNFASGQSTEIATPEKAPHRGSPGLSVSPDGRSILYAQMDQSGSDIMLVDNFR